MAQHATGHTSLTEVQAAATYTVPVAPFITSVWLLHRRAAQVSTTSGALSPVAALVVLATTFAPFSVLCTGVIVSLMMGAHLFATRRSTRER